MHMVGDKAVEQSVWMIQSANHSANLDAVDCALSNSPVVLCSQRIKQSELRWRFGLL